MLPLVSVAAINYNNAKYVIDTLASITRQTYPNIELVIVDDCSTDNSVALISEWLKHCSRKYIFIRHEANKGVCAACNSALKHATGKYYTQTGTDDTMLPERIAKQVWILEATGNEVGALYSDAYVMDVNSAPLEGLFIQRHRQFSQYPSGRMYETLLHGNFLPAMTVLIKRSVFDDVGCFDERLVYDDYDMWLRIARKYEIRYSDFVSARYRIRPDSLSFTTRNWKPSDVRIFLKHTDSVALPVDRLKRITAEAYATGDAETMRLIWALGKSTESNYFKLAWILWKAKVNFQTAEVILARTDSYIREKRNSLYIHLCLLKDIYGAYRTGNATFLS